MEFGTFFHYLRFFFIITTIILIIIKVVSQVKHTFFLPMLL